MLSTVITAVVGATALAHAQPAEPAPDANTGSAEQGSGNVQPTLHRPVAHVVQQTRAYTDRNTNSDDVFLAKPGDVLYPATAEGMWTLVESSEGKAGWMLTSRLVLDGATGPKPDDPYGEIMPAAPPPKPRKPDPRIEMPVVLATPTGWLLPAAVLYSRTAIDTGGGISSDNRVGLGDVAEFGLATSDNVRIKANSAATITDRIQPYVTASFRMGVAENRLFDNQPGLVLGFRKSFERTFENTKTRLAELTFVASKRLGSRAAIHVGGAFWDAQMHGVRADNTTFDEAMHDYPSRKDQIRPFGGIQVRPLERSEILVDLGWAPEFCKDCARNKAITLRPELSWGVRYEVADWMLLESGVRVPDIGNANLLNAQIFGQVTFVSWALRHKVDDLD
jgi:hypothetical protein